MPHAAADDRQQDRHQQDRYRQDAGSQEQAHVTAHVAWSCLLKRVACIVK